MNKLNKTFKINPLYEADGYKVGHHSMLADGTDFEYWHWIPRSLKYLPKEIKGIVSAGQQIVARYVHSAFQENFFSQPIEEASRFVRDMSRYLGCEYDGRHFEQLYRLGYLPIEIQALPEGVTTPANIPHMTGINTVSGFAWLGLFLETMISKLAWQTPTAATIAKRFKDVAVEYVTKTDPERLFLADFMCHDFHSRGGNPFTSIAVGLGHRIGGNKGSDTLNVIPASRYYYDFSEEDTPVYSVNASEHSVTCTGIFFYEKELREGRMSESIQEYYSFDVVCEGSVDEPDYLAIAEWLNLRRWLKKFPTGILSVVSDTFDLWKLITFILPRLKKEIMERDGKLVIRPDSGNPVVITCGINFSFNLIDAGEKRIPYFNIEEKAFYKVDAVNYNEISEKTTYKATEKLDLTVNEAKGVIELLWDIFGGTVSSTGYKVLDSHIGMIYGDSINLERQVQIYSRLADKKFAATNVVLGIGSYTYVYQTRDSAGFAAKGAWFSTENNALGYDIFKDPITDDGTKKSLRGFQFVSVADGVITSTQCDREKAFSSENMLKTIYKDGQFFNQTTLEEIDARI